MGLFSASTFSPYLKQWRIDVMKIVIYLIVDYTWLMALNFNII